MPQKNQKLIKLCGACREHLAEQLEKNIPQTGKIKGCGVHFANIIPGWQMANCGLRVTQSYKGNDLRSLEIYGTYPDGSGYEIKNYLTAGTNSELIAYLKEESLTREMIGIFEHFSESIADKL